MTNTNYTIQKLEKDNRKLQEEIQNLKLTIENLCEENKILKKENEGLRGENKQLREENEKIKGENIVLKKDVELYQKDLDKIKREFEEYKMRHPETVGVKHGKPYVYKASTTSRSSKKPGAQIGHKPHFRPMPTQIDEVHELPVNICPHCGGSDLSEVQEIRTRTIEDIPVCRPVVKQYRIERRYCRTCKKLVEASFTDALPNARLGIRTMVAVLWLKIELRVTEEAIPKLLKKFFGIQISEGEVIHILSQLADAFGPYYKQLLSKIRKAPGRGIDETSWRINGMNAWLWTFVTEGEALYKIAYSRSHKVPLKVLGKNHSGVNTTDGFSAYKTLARKTGNGPHQLCWAHILADSKELAQFYGEDGKVIHKVLKKIYEEAKKVEHKGTSEDVERLQHYLEFNLDRSYKSHRCRKFVENILKNKDNLFIFVTNPHVSATNNNAERALRHGVIARKISGGSRSDRGARIYERLMSIIQTFKLKGLDIMKHGHPIMLTSHG